MDEDIDEREHRQAALDIDSLGIFTRSMINYEGRMSAILQKLKSGEAYNLKKRILALEADSETGRALSTYPETRKSPSELSE